MQKYFLFFILLIAFSLAIRMPFLWHPDQVVFDEVHFGEFVSAYYTGEYYFDIHPPLGKLLIAGFAYFFDFRAGFDFANIGAEYGDIPYVALRFLPNLAGALIPAAAVAFLLSLGIPKAAAFIAGALLALDGALLVQSRFILVDAFLILFGFAGLWLFFRARNRGYRAGDLILAGAVLAMSFSVKWTGLAFFGLAIAVMLWDLLAGSRGIFRNRMSSRSLFGRAQRALASGKPRALLGQHALPPRFSSYARNLENHSRLLRQKLHAAPVPPSPRSGFSGRYFCLARLLDFPRTLRTPCESQRQGVLMSILVYFDFAFETRAALCAGRDAGRNINSDPAPTRRRGEAGENRMRKRRSPTEQSEGARFPEGFRAISNRTRAPNLWCSAEHQAALGALACPAGVIGRAESGARFVLSFVLFIMTAIALYLAVFWVHFSLLPNPGPGDVFMSENFREQSFLAQTIELNYVMFAANHGLEATHPSASPAWSWPLMARSILYWVGNVENQNLGEEPRTAWIYLLGNPVVWWFSTIGLFAGVFFWRPKSKILAEAKWILYAGWLMHMLPFLGIQRVVFLYHYLPALVFAVAIFSAWLYDALPRAKLAPVAGAIIVVAAIAFIFFAPLLYGLPLSESQLEMRMWLPGWR